MSKKAIEYLKENKDKYSKEKLLNSLRKGGYSEEDIQTSVRVVYDEQAESKKNYSSFWDFKTKKVYTSKSDKFLDFIVGFLFPLVFFTIPVLGILLFMPLIIIGAGLTFKNRRFISYGLLSWIVLIVLLIGVVIFFLRSFYNF